MIKPLKVDISEAVLTVAKDINKTEPFTFKTANGSPRSYQRGDIVSNQGKFYKCVKYTKKSPLENPSSWSFTGTTEIYKNSVPPIKPLENQLWLADTGVLYTWYKDVNGFQWVQI